ncbi:hypothetical protein RUND412_006622 [Rhizina undulata]
MEPLVSKLSPILYKSASGDVVLLDIPSSISHPPSHALVSCSPLGAPYSLPEPKDPKTIFNQELLEIHSRLREKLIQSFEDVRRNYSGAWCHPRVTCSSNPQDLNSELEYHANICMLQNALSLEDDDDADPEPLLLCPNSTFTDISDLHSQIVASPHDCWITLTLSYPAPPKIFHIPPKSSFLLSPFLSSIENFKRYVHSTLDFVLLDPPWPNRSAERSKNYWTLSRFSVNSLLRLPLDEVLKDGALVAVWITNKPKFRHFVLEKAFPKWGLEEAGEWVWTKVTAKGEPIFDIESRMRKPYESLIFGRKRGGNGEIRKVPGKVIFSVPDLHSRKPGIKELIEPHLPTPYKACEMFGRNLTEGWFTWGDEAIKWDWDGYLAPVASGIVG